MRHTGPLLDDHHAQQADHDQHEPAFDRAQPVQARRQPRRQPEPGNVHDLHDTRARSVTWPVTAGENHEVGGRMFRNFDGIPRQTRDVYGQSLGRDVA